MANSKLRCKQCLDWFAADSMMKTPRGTFCSMAHAIEWGRKQAQKKAGNARKKAERERKAKHKADKERIKPLRTVCSDAQKDVNNMIRAVDNYLGYRCVATGREIEHAGHYVHAGSKYGISWLRFFHGNIHGQHGESNTHKSGDTVNYRIGLVDRYGEDYVKDVEQFKLMEDRGEIPVPTREEVYAMAAWCRAMTRIYKRMS